LPDWQNAPVLTEPRTSVLLTTWKLVALSGFWLPLSLKTRWALDVDGKLNLPIPVRVVAVSSAVMPPCRPTL
jgi:hypothetical protein